MLILQSPPSICLSVRLSVHLSVCPSRYLLNHWTKSNQIWCVCCSLFCPALWGPGEGPKYQILLNIIKFQLQSQFQRFLNQTLCVYSQIKDIKHIRRDFHLAAPSCPRGGTCGFRGELGVNFFSKIEPELVCE